MSEKNPIHHLLQAFQNVSSCVQTHLSNLVNRSSIPPRNPLLQISSSSSSSSNVHPDPTGFFPLESDLNKEKTAALTSKEELGRATWTFLHTLAAQYPDKPTRQQKRDVRELMAILSRMYPCKECADHFKEILRANPVQVGSHAEFSQWLCHVHNVVNRSLGKPVFPCERVDGRWGKLECEQRACDVLGATSFWS